jgi:hypothetical protein
MFEDLVYASGSTAGLSVTSGLQTNPMMTDIRLGGRKYEAVDPATGLTRRL